MLMVSARTAKKWPTATGLKVPAGWATGPRPHGSPARTSPELVRQIVQLRWRHRLGPVQIAGHSDAGSTVHAVLVRCRINRLSTSTASPANRCAVQHDHPGSLIHVDVTNLGNIPTAADTSSSTVSRASSMPRPQHAGPVSVAAVPAPHRDRVRAHRHRRSLPHGLCRDLHRREGHHRDRRSAPSRGLVRRPRRHRAASAKRQRSGLPVVCRRGPAPSSTSRPSGRGPTVPRPTAKSRDSTGPWPTAGPTPGSTKSSAQRNAALPHWLHIYNHHRAHSAIGGRPPITRLTNVPGHEN